MKKLAVVGILLISSASLVPALSAAVSLDELEKRIQTCNLVLKNVLAMPDRGIPRDLLTRCRGVAVFPGVIKAGLVIGVSYGDGIVLRRDETTGEWSRPAFFRIRGGSIGLQVGAQSTDVILLIISERGVEGLLEDKITLGADVSVAAGPIGREASAETDRRFDAGILSYSRAKGLFAGVALKGAVLEPEKEANEVYHGKDLTVQDVFYDNKGALSDNARLLIKTLENAVK